MGTIEGSTSVDFNLRKSKSSHYKLITAAAPGKKQQATTEQRKKVKSQATVRNPHLKTLKKKDEF